MRSACHAAMDEDIFDRLPSSTNAVESHNRLSKGSNPDVLRVALMSTYKINMSNALEYVARDKGVSTSYEDLSTDSKETRRKMANTARARKRLNEEESDGPPDKHNDFKKGTMYLICEM